MSIEATLSEMVQHSLAFSRTLIEREIGRTNYGSQMLQILTQSQPRNAASMALSGLPCLTLLANQGDPEKSIPLVAAWQCLQLAAKLFDDVEDEHPTDSALRINTATGFLFVAQLALLESRKSHIPAGCVHSLIAQFNRASLQACSGQHADLFIHPALEKVSPRTWLSIARKKSGELFGWAAWSGAKAARSSREICREYDRLGVEIGVLLQVADDYNGIWNPDGHSDLFSDCATLPLSYFRYVANAEEQIRFSRLVDLASQGDPDAERSARELLAGMGAEQYCIATAWICQQKVLTLLEKVNSGLQVKTYVVDLLEQIFPLHPNTVSAHE